MPNNEIPLQVVPHLTGYVVKDIKTGKRFSGKPISLEAAQRQLAHIIESMAKKAQQ